ncbi:HIT family protein [Aquimarina sp. I32.4]|uniref:HIT family protein n=1 Tax=Aquimarina sp. I32.4 TaxID=2053903 RepID=UPI000CDECCF0|nr:HIT family protein [Aquimarina sp. I32.4]
MNTCIFCKIVKGEAKSWKVFENEDACAFLDIHPATRYHTLVIPKKHYTNVFDIPEKELQSVMTAVKKVCMLYKEKLGIQNLQVISNSGAVAQQEVFHLHFHIVPRKWGDGQNLKWNTHPEWVQDFDTMIAEL